MSASSASLNSAIHDLERAMNLAVGIANGSEGIHELIGHLKASVEIAKSNRAIDEKYSSTVTPVFPTKPTTAIVSHYG